MVATAATSSIFPVASPPPDSGTKTSGKFRGLPSKLDARGLKLKTSSSSSSSGSLKVKASAQAPPKVNGTKVSRMEGLKNEGEISLPPARTFINQLPDWSMLLAAVTTIFLAAEKQWMMLDWKPRRPDMLADPFGLGKIVQDGFVFRQNFSIRSYEIGADRTASIETLMNHLQETALNHVRSAGLLGNGFGSTPEMCKRNLIWVVSKMQVIVDRYPTWNDIVQVDTWVAASGKNGMRRDWLVRDANTGHILTRATSVFVMMNGKTRKLARMPDEVRDEIGPYFVDSPPVVDDDKRKLPKLDESTADRVRSGLTPKWSDLDVNQHVNNVKYIGWILESTPQPVLETHELSAMTLEYRRECGCDSVLQSLPDIHTYTQREREREREMEMVDPSMVARARLAVLSAHLSAAVDSGTFSPVIEPSIVSAAVAPPPNLSGSLTIVDERTGKGYQVQVDENGTVKATDLKKISIGKNDKGLKLYDPGYLNTAPVRSSICYIDGDEGVLRYRGFPIEELADGSSFLEVAYLLLYGNLPSENQLADWEFAVSQHSAVPQGILDIIQAMPHDAHPMGVLCSALSALSVFHPDANPSLRGQDLYKSKQVRDKQIVRILGKAPTIAAAAYLRLAGRPPVLPSSNLSYSENFLYMLDSLGNRTYKPNPRLARVLDILFILHAEHEMNCSTAATRHLASSGVDVYTALSGAVGALYGPLHGGANEAVLKMLNEIGCVDNIPDFIEGVKNRKRKMSGFGHRVYKNYDPRAKVIKQLAEEVFSIVGRDPLIEVAVALEKAALSDEYFVKRKLYPNVDFYSGLIYRAMGFPTEFFPVLFAIPRMAGYLSHWRESLDDPDTKIMRPAQVYTGVWLRHYMPPRERIVQNVPDKLGQVSVSNATRRRLAGSGA